MAEGEFEHLGRDGDWLVNLCLLGEASSYLGDIERAATLVDLLSPFAGLHAVAAGELALGAVAHHVGRLTGELGRFDEAESHFEAALELNAHMGARPWVAHTQTDYARMLLVKGGTAERRRAGDLLARAVSEYETLEMRGAARRACVLAASAS